MTTQSSTPAANLVPGQRVWFAYAQRTVHAVRPVRPEVRKDHVVLDFEGRGGQIERGYMTPASEPVRVLS